MSKRVALGLHSEHILQPSIHHACMHNLGHKAWVFMATRRDLAHTMSWNGKHRHNNEDIPGEAKTFKQVVHTSGLCTHNVVEGAA